MKTIQPDSDRIAITGMGLVTSLGCGAPSSVAAIRSGIANFSEHETVVVNGNADGTELSGAKMARLPEHVVSRRLRGTDRAVSMLAPAIRQCSWGLPRDMLTQAHWRMDSHIEPEICDFPDKLKADLHDLPLPALQINNSAVLALGRCLFFENIIQAVADLHHGTCQLAFVGCVDSLCDSTMLVRLHEMGRLNSGSNPEGIIAGEAAGVVLLEMESHARRRNAEIHAYISAHGSGTEPNPWTGTIPSTSQGLTSAFLEAFAQLPGNGAEIVVVIADLNGERARAHDWSFTAGRIFPIDDKTRDLKHPADCVGDCGGAMGAVLLATGAGLLSGALPPANIALSISDDGAARRVLCLEKGDARDQDAVINAEQKKCQILLPTVIEQHMDDLPFLWLLRNGLTKAPDRGLDELARHDQRIAANLDGLCLAGETAWEMCRGSLRQGDAGEYFAASLLAFKSGNEDHITYLLGNADTNRIQSKGIISALGWLPYPQAQPYINRLIAEQSPDLCRIGIAASAIHRVNPGSYLKEAMLNDNHSLKARAFKAAGELGRMELLPQLKEHLDHQDEACRFYAAWSAALFGYKNALRVLQTVAVSSTRYQQEAANTAFLIMERQDALKWHAEFAANPETVRLAVTGAGTIGDPALIPWLVDQMKTASLARVAGEAFTLITGADILSDGLKGARPVGFETGPTDDPDDDDGLDADENLPWPDPELVERWWRQHRDQFSYGVRYFLGKAASIGHLQQVLCSGSQRQRAIAALESALSSPGLPIFETRAPGFRQLATLTAKCPSFRA